MKLSWGYRIAFLYIGFVLLIITMVALTMREKVELTYADYYKREIEYDKILKKETNFNLLKQDLKITQNQKQIIIQLPNKSVNNFKQGKIILLRPSDAKLDKDLPFTIQQNNLIVIEKTILKKGYYLLQLDWSTNEKDFFIEKSITIN
ncbi:MAG: FixH family protein [Bacteroidia bacterium]|nr:FixH family protein [Bacteroidia bacterium]